MHSRQIKSTAWFALPRLLFGQPGVFTAAEVRQRLRRGDSADPRTVAVRAAAARSSIWSAHVAPDDAFELGRTATRLPTVVYWYSQGQSCAEIGRRLSAFGGAWDADRAMDLAAGLIARVLNRGEIADTAA